MRRRGEEAQGRGEKNPCGLDIRDIRVLSVLVQSASLEGVGERKQRQELRILN